MWTKDPIMNREQQQALYEQWFPTTTMIAPNQPKVPLQEMMDKPLADHGWWWVLIPRLILRYLPFCHHKLLTIHFDSQMVNKPSLSSLLVDKRSWPWLMQTSTPTEPMEMRVHIQPVNHYPPATNQRRHLWLTIMNMIITDWYWLIIDWW